MPSYLSVSFPCRRAFFKAQAPEQGILAELVLDVDDGLLHPPFTGIPFRFGLPFLFLHLMIRKQIQLDRPARLPHLCFTDHMTGRDIQPPDEQSAVYDLIIKGKDSFTDLL